MLTAGYVFRDVKSTRAGPTSAEIQELRRHLLKAICDSQVDTERRLQSAIDGATRQLGKDIQRVEGDLKKRRTLSLSLSVGAKPRTLKASSPDSISDLPQRAAPLVEPNS